MMKNIDSEKINLEISDMILKFNLIEQRNMKISELSGGMKQRLAIIQALLGEPAIIILDEPMVALDPIERIRFRNIINEKSKNSIIIISTHIISDIAMICDNIGIMRQGKILYSGSITDLLTIVDNKVYIDEFKIDKQIDLKKYKNIISIQRKKDKSLVRFISNENNLISYTKVEPNLEDAYFYITNVLGKNEIIY